jgi:alkylhydroperoxidase family enzyme
VDRGQGVALPVAGFFYPERPAFLREPTAMRLHYIPPAELSAEQKPLYDDMRQGIEATFKGFANIRDDGALMGPWNPWIHYPRIGRAVWDLTKTLASQSKLEPAIREIAILVTGAHFRAAYELYAHVALAEKKGLEDVKLRVVVAGQRPHDLTEHEAIAYDLAASLVAGGVLPQLVYDAAVKLLGAEGTAELIQLIGLYALVCVTLNGFDVPIPGDAE